MALIKTHKIRLIPTENQKADLFRAFAASRYAWNFAKEILDLEYHYDSDLYRATGENHKLTSPLRLKKIFNRVKPDWLKGTGTATQESFSDVQKALRRYWDIRKGKIKIPNSNNPFRKDGFLRGWLRWRRKGHNESFRQTYVSLKFDDKRVSYNAKVGYIKLSEKLRFDGNPKSATFSYDGIHFWVSVNVEVTKTDVVKVLEKRGEFIGVDLGIKSFAKTSRPLRDGKNTIDNPRATKRYERKLARLQRKLDRQCRDNNPDYYDEKGQFKRGSSTKWVESGQMAKSRRAIKKLHIRIANIRNNTQHQLTSQLSKDFEYSGIEDLNVAGMLKNRKLAKHISDVGFSEIRRQLEYKGDWYGSKAVIVDRFFPSSKTCSNCGAINRDLKLSDRLWSCDSCGAVHDRDENAAINLENEARKIVSNSP